MSEIDNFLKLKPMELPQQLNFLGNLHHYQLEPVMSEQQDNTVIGIRAKATLEDGSTVSCILNTSHIFRRARHYWADQQGYTTYWVEAGQLHSENTPYQYDYPWQEWMDGD